MKMYDLPEFKLPGFSLESDEEYQVSWKVINFRMVSQQRRAPFCMFIHQGCICSFKCPAVVVCWWNIVAIYAQTPSSVLTNAAPEKYSISSPLVIIVMIIILNYV